MFVLIGANGFLGSYCIKTILENTSESIFATARNILNVKNFERVKWCSCDIQSDKSVDDLIKIISNYSEIKVIFFAAYHKPDDVEKNKYLAWDINVTCLSKFINKLSFASKIFYASTDSVYGDSINGYHFTELDSLNPVNFYGRTKCAAESILLNLGRNVVRFPFLISPSLIYKEHFYDQIVTSLKQGKTVDMFFDSYRSSLSFDNASFLLIKLMMLDSVPQIVNICGDRDLSKFDVGKLIAKRENLDVNLIRPVSVNNYINFSSNRACSTLMSNNLLKNILNLSFIDIFDKPF